MRYLWLAVLGTWLWLVGAHTARALELPCRYENALSEAAAEIVLTGRTVDTKLLLPTVRALGFDGVFVHAHEGHDEAALIQWIKALGERSDGPLVCGEARSDARWLVLVSSRGGRLWRDGTKLFGGLEPGFGKPHLVVEDREGHTHKLEVAMSELTKGVLLPAELSAKRVQLVAEGPNGPRPVSELDLDGVPPMPALREAVATGSEPPRRGPRMRPIDVLLARLDSFRARSGAGALRQNDLLSKSAQRHAERVCQLGRVAHRLEGGDDPETRLRAERISARAVGEAVARAGSADDALEAVFESPSHRMAVSERRFTDAGIGQALDQRGNTCLVVLLASWPRRLP